MDDPFSAIKIALQTPFRLAPMRNGTYTYPEIQRLKTALENFTPNNKQTFDELVKSLGESLHHFEKWRIDFEEIHQAIYILAQHHKIPADICDKLLSRSKLSTRFQFNTKQATELIPWISSTSEKKFNKLKPIEQINLLVTQSHNLGFSQKISAHLKKDPDFLSRFIMESIESFTKIANSRLIFYLTDVQIAQAIIKYLPHLIQEHPNQFIQVEHLMDKINAKILSNGRSISTILRNEEAKSILEQSKFFKIYQSDEYMNRQTDATVTEKRALKSNF